MIPVDPVTMTAAAGVASAGVAFFLGRRIVRPKAGRATSTAYSKQDQAIGEVELIEALAALSLPAETARMLKEKVTTLQQLEDTVAMIRGGANQSVLEKMIPCAVAYAKQRSTTFDLMAKALVIAQCNAPQGIVHPAFADIASDILVAGEWFIEPMKVKICEMEQCIQSGPWIDTSLCAKGREENRHRRLSSPMFRSDQGHTWDVIEPSEKGTIQIKRITSYDDLGSVTSRFVPAEFEAGQTTEERLFWLSFARGQIDQMLDRTRQRTGFSVYGNLLSWTRFMAALG